MNPADNPLQEAKEILNDLESDLEKEKCLWKQIALDNPSFDQVSEEAWKKKQAQSWIHCGTDIREINELGRWLHDNPPLTPIAQSSARNIRKNWKNWLEKKDFKGAYYSEFPEFDIQPPNKGETLIDFVIRLAKTVEDNGLGKRLKKRALKSFLGFLSFVHDKNLVSYRAFPRF